MDSVWRGLVQILNGSLELTQACTSHQIFAMASHQLKLQFSHLAEDIVYEILSHLPITDIICVRRVRHLALIQNPVIDLDPSPDLQTTSGGDSSTSSLGQCLPQIRSVETRRAFVYPHCPGAGDNTRARI
jgi:hypothetical protein